MKGKSNKKEGRVPIVFDVELLVTIMRMSSRKMQTLVHDLLLWRRQRGYTQGDLATIVGLPQSRISEIERLKTTDISLMRFLVLAHALGLTVELRPIPPSTSDALDTAAPYEPINEQAKDPTSISAGAGEEQTQFVPRELKELLAGGRGTEIRLGKAFAAAVQPVQTDNES